MAATTIKEAPLVGASDLDRLRRARADLRDAIAAGAGYLEPVLDEVEDALIEVLAARRKETQR